MEIESTVPDVPASRTAAFLSGLPGADGYRLVVKPLRYRNRPHLAAWTEFDRRTITLKLPEPFLPFGEIIPYAARRVPGKGMRFVWLTEGVTFREPREVLRFLYLHEWMHWYQRERLGRKGFGETACDRFALRHYASESVSVEEAQRALARR